MVAGAGPAARVAELIEPTVEALGYELVRVRTMGDGAGKDAKRAKPGGTLQIMAERPDGTMTVAGCQEVSQAVSALLDVEDPIAGAYMLEVSSPGIDRPLTRPKDFERWAGYEVKLELRDLLAGRRRFRGILQGIEDGEVLLEVDLDEYDEPQTVGVPFDALSEARLVMSDDLLKKDLKKDKHQA